MDGLELLQVVKQDYPYLPIIMISGHGTIKTAVKAMQQGAFDYLEKPFKTDKLLHVIKLALESTRLRRENQELRIHHRHCDMIGQSVGMQSLMQQIERAAPTNSRVLLTGQPGCGKEMAARTIHQKSQRKDGPFVVANCAMMTPDRLELELFGTEPGYYNTAMAPSEAEANHVTTNFGKQRKIGLFELAHKGSLLLDEVADMPKETQGKLVRLLQEQKFSRLGSSNPIQVDVRVISASNKDLEQEIRNGRLREDLYYRLRVVPIHVPPLQERRDDIIALVQYFMEKASKGAGIPIKRLSTDALAALQAYHWPGNIRQLQNVMEWLLIMAPVNGNGDEEITTDMLPPEIYKNAPVVLKSDKSDQIMSLPLREARETFEREYLTAQVTRFNGNISRTANFVGMERSALHRKLKNLGLHHPSHNNGSLQDTLSGSEPQANPATNDRDKETSSEKTLEMA